MKRAVLFGAALILMSTATGSGVARKGPYLIYPGENTRMMVLWQLYTTQACTLEWGLDASYSGGSAVTNEYGTSHQHKYTITGLSPGGKYYYRVTAGAEQYTGSFRAAPPDGATEVKLLAYGDTRTNVFDHDTVDAAMLATFTADPDYQTFTMLSGDWVSDGEQEGDWDEQFFNPLALNTRQLQANLPINGCMGNHEWEDDETPPTYFDKYYPYPYVAGFYWSFDYGPVHVVVVDQYLESYGEGSGQLAWLETDLASTNRQWKILQFHEPAYSAGGGHDDDTATQQYLQPLCEKYGVDLVIAGHNHYYARCDRNGVKHITAGGGGAPLRPPDPHYSPYVEVATEAYHFCKIHVNGRELAFTAVKPDGTIIDQFNIIHPVVELVGPPDGAVLDADGAVFSCEPIPDATSYQLLFGPDPNHLSFLVSEGETPPADPITDFPFEQTWWTMKVRTQRGYTLYADPIHFHAANVAPLPVENLNKGTRYGFIQQAVDDAATSDEIVVGAGNWQYLENVTIQDKSVTVRSSNPDDPEVVSRTVINGGGRGPAVTISGLGSANCVLRGLTIKGGNRDSRGNGGVLSSGTGTRGSPTISQCVIVENDSNGVHSIDGIPNIVNCTIARNGGCGVACEGRRFPFITSSLIVGNKMHGVHGDFARLTNCTVVGNTDSGVSSYGCIMKSSIVRDNGSAETDNLVDFGSSTVTYSCVEGGWPGTGNMSADPCFVSPGYRDTDGLWSAGDYRLRPVSVCVNRGDPDYVAASGETDMQGRPRIAGGRVDMGAYEVTSNQNKAWFPNPADGAVSVRSVTADVILSWLPGDNIGSGGEHRIYFGTGYLAVANADQESDEYKGSKALGDEHYNAGRFESWKMLYWRVDEAVDPSGEIIAGDIWRFTTGCLLIDGDVNLDCVVDFRDFAALSDTWLQRQFFPHE